MLRFLSTLSLRRATYRPCVHVVGRSISIHALLAESDCIITVLSIVNVISIHALLAESDFNNGLAQWSNTKFLSTLSLRRATTGIFLYLTFHEHFYPRSPCGERLFLYFIPSIGTLHFYPRSPCGERLTSSFSIFWICHFYPRSPCGERPDTSRTVCNVISISIHALLAESDQAANGFANAPPQISIHALLAESDRH